MTGNGSRMSITQTEIKANLTCASKEEDNYYQKYLETAKQPESGVSFDKKDKKSGKKKKEIGDLKKNSNNRVQKLIKKW